MVSWFNGFLNMGNSNQLLLFIWKLLIWWIECLARFSNQFLLFIWKLLFGLLQEGAQVHLSIHLSTRGDLDRWMGRCRWKFTMIYIWYETSRLLMRSNHPNLWFKGPCPTKSAPTEWKATDCTVPFNHSPVQEIKSLLASDDPS